MSDFIALTDCEERSVYRLDSRNLALGVFRKSPGGFGTAGFVGIRTKFGQRYLDEEYHWDEGPPHGTAKPLEELGELPQSMTPAPREGSTCTSCGGRAWWTGPPAPASWECEGECENTLPHAEPNDDLFVYLDSLQPQTTPDP